MFASVAAAVLLVSASALAAPALSGACVPSETVLCLDGSPGDQRFRVELAFQSAQGGGIAGPGHAIPLASLGVSSGGLFWFFGRSNPEVLVKLLDGCGVNGQRWFFASAGTNVGLTTTVTDTRTGAVRTYTNPDLNAAAPIQDTSAFACSAAAETITIGLERLLSGTATVSFGLPLRPGAVSDTSGIHVTIGGRPVDAHVKPLLRAHDASGDPSGLRAVLVQFPASLMPGPTLAVGVTLGEPGPAPPSTVTPFASLSFASSETARVVDRTIVRDGSTYRLQESNPRTVTLFTGREPAVIAHFPPGYLARTSFLGPQVSAADVAADAGRAGLRFLSDALTPFVRSATYEESYALNPDPGSVVDPVVNYEGWLYDRCATLLTASSHVGDASMLRHALRACSYYSSRIVLDGPNRGIYSGKSDPDLKYSHLRGLTAYYALTGDEGALASAKAIADLWITEPLTIGPYRQGHLRGPDRLWTERLLGTGLEGLYYGFRVTDDKAYLAAFKEVLDTAYRHVTTASPSELSAINVDPNLPPFPPQDCWIHNALQAGEGNPNEPWCSGWMNELVIDSLLAFQEQTGDPRVDEIFVRLSRFLRDVGSSYFQGNPLGDTFLAPAVCYDPSRGVDTRILIPLYGSGLFADRTRGNYGQYDDFEHCTDATALTAAAPRPGGLDERRTVRRGGQPRCLHPREQDRLPQPPVDAPAQAELVVQHVDAAVRAAPRGWHCASDPPARCGPAGRPELSAPAVTRPRRARPLRLRRNAARAARSWPRRDCRGSCTRAGRS